LYSKDSSQPQDFDETWNVGDFSRFHALRLQPPLWLGLF
jgi:hypothetical protein